MASSQASAGSNQQQPKECGEKQPVVTHCRADVASSEASAASNQHAQVAVEEEAREPEQTVVHDNFVPIYEAIENLYWEYKDKEVPAHVDKLECSLWERRSELLRELVKSRTPPKLKCQCVYCTKYGLDFVVRDGM